MGLLDTLLSSTVGVVQQERQNAFNAREAEKNRVFNAEQAQLAFQRELSADSSKYQRATADMLAAGLNPMLAAGSGGGAVHSSPATGTPASAASVGNLGELFLQGEQLKIQKRLADAEVANTRAKIANTEADTAKKQSEITSVDLANEITRLSKEARVESFDIINDLNRSKINEVNSVIDQISSNIRLLEEQAETESSKREYYFARGIAARVDAQTALEMLPYQKVLASAQTENQRTAAALAAAHTAYQNKLISDGYIDAFVSKMKADERSSEALAAVNELKSALRTGDYSKVDGMAKIPVISEVMQGIINFVDNLNPLSNWSTLPKP